MDAFTTETKKKITEDRKELDVRCRENSDSFKDSLASLTSNINNIKTSLQDSLKHVKGDFQDFQTSGKRLLEERIRKEKNTQYSSEHLYFYSSITFLFQSASRYNIETEQQGGQPGGSGVEGVQAQDQGVGEEDPRHDNVIEECKLDSLPMNRFCSIFQKIFFCPC